ncbi:MAG TPA: UDP-N-acetylmuramate dehydrogenase [Acidimicrobiales bacterium]|jgi:UDP-N-acetylmuramate dehydrogenase|nr:UDP-N-acetylmuramate dehydrogenase [Acidimicrobiales bacterium]
MSSRTDDLARLGRALGDRATAGRPLGAVTTYRVGGPAALTTEPVGEDELVDLARRLEGLDVPVLVLGRGSNLLVADRGFDGLVVSLGAAFESITVEGPQVRAGAAVALPVLARRTVSAGLSGLEWAVGVPGSVGGAIRMNAGGHGSDTAATLLACRWVDLATGAVHDGPAASIGLAYRHSRLAPTDVVVSATYGLEPGPVELGRSAIDEIVRWRRANQPGGSNAGSVFSNPPGDSAGRLIEASGLKGFRLGSAEVSSKHANFFQADPGGSADDVRRLMAHVQEEVAAASGVVLHPEVCLIGFEESGGTR